MTMEDELKYLDKLFEKKLSSQKIGSPVDGWESLAGKLAMPKTGLFFRPEFFLNSVAGIILTGAAITGLALLYVFNDGSAAEKDIKQVEIQGNDQSVFKDPEIPDNHFYRINGIGDQTDAFVNQPDQPKSETRISHLQPEQTSENVSGKSINPQRENHLADQIYLHKSGSHHQNSNNKAISREEDYLAADAQTGEFSVDTDPNSANSANQNNESALNQSRQLVQVSDQHTNMPQEENIELKNANDLSLTEWQESALVNPEGIESDKEMQTGRSSGNLISEISFDRFGSPDRMKEKGPDPIYLKIDQETQYFHPDHKNFTPDYRRPISWNTSVFYGIPFIKADLRTSKPEIKPAIPFLLEGLQKPEGFQAGVRIEGQYGNLVLESGASLLQIRQDGKYLFSEQIIRDSLIFHLFDTSYTVIDTVGSYFQIISGDTTWFWITHETNVHLVDTIPQYLHDTSLVTIVKPVKSVFRYIEIPLLVGYSRTYGRITTSVRAGVVSSFQWNSYGKLISVSSGNEVYKITRDQLPSVRLDGYSSLEVRYFLAPRYFLFGEAWIRRPFTAILKHESVEYYYFLHGIRLGAGISF
jgi:hypothetical protein